MKKLRQQKKSAFAFWLTKQFLVKVKKTNRKNLPLIAADFL